MKTILLITLVLFGLNRLAAQTPYLLAGNADPTLMNGFDVLLLQPDGQGGVRIVEEIVTSQKPVDWIGFSLQLRKAVISAEKEFVLDLDRVAVTKGCKFPPLRNVSRVGQWLTDLPGLGPSFTILVAGDTDAQRGYWSMSLDPDAPCKDSFFPTPPLDMRHAVVTGSHRVFINGAWDRQDAHINDDGSIGQWLLPTPLGDPAPTWVKNRLATRSSIIMINTRELFAIVAARTGGPPPKDQQNGIAVERKRDGKWIWLPLMPEESRVYFRGFESYLARTEAFNRPTPPNHKWWRQQPARTGPSNPGLYALSELYFPGRVHIHDIENDHQYTITTNEPDTEVILIAGNTAYYRVNDKLLEVELRNGILGKPKLIAQSDLIGDAHWAFLK